MGRIRILLADEQALIRDGLKAVLTDDEFVVVAEASDGPSTMEEARKAQPDVVVMDLLTCSKDGVETARNLVREMPDMKVMILTSHAEEKLVSECLKTGVHGFVLKGVETTDLKRHIRAIVRGEAALDPKVAGLLMAQFRRGRTGAQSQSVLTAQQMAILRLVAKGYSNRQIAKELHLSENTVKGYAAEILHRLGVKNRVQAATLATSKGWI